jgi:thiamine biosynthesis lipoprotein
VTTVVEVTRAAMGTVFAVQLSGADHTTLRDRATTAFRLVEIVESTCSRFREDSELSRVSATCGDPQPVTPMLFEILALALAVAEASDGAFDPTVGRQLSRLGHDTRWESGERRVVPPPTLASWRDVELDRPQQQVTLHAPLHLDLGAIAKGFAVDLIAQSLDDVPQLSIHAGGDVVCRGAHPDRRPWQVGITDPANPDRLIARAALAAGAVCTSGNYQRRRAGQSDHLLDPLRGEPAAGLASVTVVAPTAAIADALSTAAFVMGAEAGLSWIRAQGADALMVTAAGDVLTTPPSSMVTWMRS